MEKSSRAGEASLDRETELAGEIRRILTGNPPAAVRPGHDVCQREGVSMWIGELRMDRVSVFIQVR
jgi:hypothetical protein